MTQASWRPGGDSRFPRSLDDLTDTGRCPACFAPLTSPVCGACGLDLRHPAAYELVAVSQQSADALVARAGLIDRIRAEMPAAATMPAPPPPTSAAAPPAPSMQPATVAPTAPRVAPMPTPHAPAPVAESARTDRSSVQLVLLIAGVSLLSVAAIFFLVYAFFTYGIVWQSVIVGTLTLASIATAQLLAHRRLRATGEGLAVFATVLVLLDVWAIRQNDLLGAKTVDASLYAGAGLLAAIGVLWVWHWLGRLRAPGIAASALLVLALGLLTAGAVELDDRALEISLVFGVAAAGGVAQRFVRHRVDGAILGATALAALAPAALSSTFVAIRQDWGAIVPMLAAAALAAALAASLATSRRSGDDTGRTTPEARVFAAVAAGISGALLAAILLVATTRMPSFADLFGWSLLAGVTVAAGFELLAHRTARGRRRSLAASAALGAALMAAVIALAPAAVLLGNTITSAGIALQRAWRMPLHELFDAIPATPLLIATLGTAAAIVVVALAWWAAGVLRRRWPILAWFGAALLIVAPAVTDVVWVSVALSMLLVIASVATLLGARGRPVPSALRAPLAFLALGAGFFGGLTAWANPGSWAIAAVVLAAVLIAARGLVPKGGIRAVPLGIAAAIVVTLVVLAPLALASRPLGTALPYDSLLAVIVLGAILTAIGAAPTARLSVTDRHTLFWIAAVLVAGTTLRINLGLTPGTLLIEPRFGDLVASTSLLAGIALWLWSPLTRALHSTRVVAAAATGPVFAALLSSILFAAPEVVRTAIPGASAVLVTLAALVVTTRRAVDSRPAAPSTSARRRLPRWAADAGALLTASVTLLSIPGSAAQDGWLAALLLAAALFIASIGRGRPFGFGPPRGLLVWPAIVVATAALWIRLGDGGVTALEPYLIPPTLALLAVASWLNQTQQRPGEGSGALDRAAAGALLVGLLLTLIPLGIVSTDGAQPIRLTVITIVSIALLLAATGYRHPRYQRLLDAAALAGALATLTAAGGRALVLADRTPQVIAVEGWLSALVLAFLIASVLVTRAAAGSAAPARGRWSQALLAAAIIALVVVETLATAAPGLATTRALLVVLLLGALHVIAPTIEHAPFTRFTCWFAIGAAGLFAVVMLATDRVEPLETVTVPIALALLATGAIRMLQHHSTRSWPALGPGLAVLLLPSLMATAWEPSLWRLVALGVAAVTATVIGVVMRLQAPFLLGIVVALMHGIATFMPQLRAVYEAVEWWLWLGIGGVVLITLAVRYERRVRDAREAVRRIRSMR